MESAFTHWANLVAAREDSSMSLNYESLQENVERYLLPNGKRLMQWNGEKWG